MANTWVNVKNNESVVACKITGTKLTGVFYIDKSLYSKAKLASWYIDKSGCIQSKYQGKTIALQYYLTDTNKSNYTIIFKGNKFKDYRLKNLEIYEKNVYFDMGDGTVELSISGNKIDGSTYFDKELLEIVQSYVWYIEGNGYARGSKGSERVSLHKLVLPDTTIVDHIDRDRLNNRSSNLRASSYKLNNNNMSMTSRNSSGRTGIHEKTDTNNNVHWVAGWYENNKYCTRQFAVNKYGYDLARSLAEEVRSAKEIELCIENQKTKND